MKKIITDIIKIKDTQIETLIIELNNANLIMAIAPKGFLMCGYLDISVAEKLNDCACVVTGVKDVKQLLNGEVVKLTPKAKDLGIELGISGYKAIEKMI